MNEIEKLPFPQIELDDRENYRYITKENVRTALEKFGYGPTKRFVDAIYISPDNSIAVGVLHVNEEICRDHFINNPVLRGFDEGEAMAQTLLLLMHFTGRIKEDMTPRLGKSTVDPKWPVSGLQPVDLNIVVKLEENEGNSMGYGRIFCGTQIVAEGIITSNVLPADLANKLLERRKRIQAGVVPIFPLGK